MQRTIAGLLVVVIILLGANLMAGMAEPGAPVPIGIANYQTTNSGLHRVHRLWSDGSVDAILYTMAADCVVTSVCGACITGDCPADLNYDGNVGPPDLANLLENWGDCPDCPN